MCLQKFPPVCRFYKICHWTDTYMCLQKFPPGVQIFPNLPLDSYLSYLHVLTEIPSQFVDFPKICHWTDTYMCLQKCPPSLQIFQNLSLDRYLHVLTEISPWGADFPKSATGQLPKLPTCACRNSPQFADFLKSATGQIPTCACRNFPLGCRFSQICHWTVT